MWETKGAKKRGKYGLLPNPPSDKMDKEVLVLVNFALVKRPERHKKGAKDKVKRPKGRREGLQLV